MFRAERQSCLLGTDAVRDGVDVPGDSLRLIVLDRVPWSQPTILERARRQQFGGGLWQDMGVRLRLRQAFGRLIRRGDDRGVFVVLDSRLASRFCTAFPEGMTVARMGLVEAIDATSRFLGERQ
jgi:ATP-dependent DNA helicase DinG